MVLAKEKYGLRGRTMGSSDEAPQGMHFVPFSATTRDVGVDFDGTSIRKGAPDTIMELVQNLGGRLPPDLKPAVDGIARRAAHRWWWRGTSARWASST